MRKNHALAQLRAGEPSIGLWLHSGSVPLARTIAAQGLFDWLLVDLEHSPVDTSTASQMLSAIADLSAGACTPLARVSRGSLEHIRHALDGGAHGIIVPMVSTAQDAADVVRFARYPPLGERGAGGFLPHLSFGVASHAEYLREANREILVGVQIETRAAVENIEAIASTPGIDLVFVGPFDLHLSLGLTPAAWSEQPAFLEAIAEITAACQRHHVPCGTIAYTPENVQARLSSGFRFVSFGMEISQLLTALHTQMAAFRAQQSKDSASS
jgi:4-hydroxy-2-oxoheptanedioate aldolase